MPLWWNQAEFLVMIGLDALYLECLIDLTI